MITLLLTANLGLTALGVPLEEGAGFDEGVALEEGAWFGEGAALEAPVALALCPSSFRQ